jgi:hypothetical protein
MRPQLSRQAEPERWHRQRRRSLLPGMERMETQPGGAERERAKQMEWRRAMEMA